MYKRDKKNQYQFSNIADSIIAKLINLDLTPALINPNHSNDLSAPNAEEVVLLTNNKNNDQVKYGAGLGERIDLFKAYGQRFPSLHCRELIVMARLKGNAVNKKRKALEDIERWNRLFDEYEFVDLKKDKLFYEHPPVSLANQENMVIEIYTHNQQLVIAFIEFAVEILRLNKSLDPYTYKSSDGYVVTFVLKEAYIARGLSKTEQSNPRMREDEIKKSIGSDQYHSTQVLALVDIEPFHTLTSELKKQDSKQSIRNAFQEHGRITQFINGFDPEVKEDKIRLANATYDLFSATGFMDHDYFTHNFKR